MQLQNSNCEISPFYKHVAKKISMSYRQSVNNSSPFHFRKKNKKQRTQKGLWIGHITRIWRYFFPTEKVSKCPSNLAIMNQFLFTLLILCYIVMMLILHYFVLSDSIRKLEVLRIEASIQIHD